jgi:hypothetical protein
MPSVFQPAADRFAENVVIFHDENVHRSRAPLMR